MINFCHLHNHSHYSLLDAACTPAQLIEKAKKYGHKALALTDHGVMFGSMEFYKLSKKENVKPILGFEAYVANGSRFDRSAGKSKTKKKNYYHLILLAKNMAGYKNLIKLTSLAHTEGFYYKPRIDEELLEQYHEGIIATSACINGVVNAHIVREDYRTALEKAQFYKDIFGDDFYIELQDHGLPEDEIILRDAPKIAEKLGIKLVATNDIHYINKDDAVSHNVYLLIKDASQDSKIDIEQLRYSVPEMYYKSTEEMVELFKDYPEAISSTQEIADKCDLTFENKYYLPEFPVPMDSNAENLDDYLREQTYKGLNERFDEITDEIKNRADYELDVIIKMGFPGYFLIVQDFINAARKMDVRVGPGRGSAAGSIVAYALGITNVNPLPYELLFERFLNPERISMPDIDIDFCDEKREKVIQYVKKKYGEKSVAQIITFGTLSSKAVLKDVGRVLGIHYSEINKMTSKIPTELGQVFSLEKALNLPDLKWLKTTEKPEYKKLVKHSLRLEDLFRNSGTHAAGVVITPGDVVEYVPLYQSPTSKNQGADIATQYGMKHLEDAGLLKMDFLGLRTLSIIDNTLEMIEKNYKKIIDIDNVPLDDPKVFDIFCEGRTLGIFQFESDGMKNYLMQLKPKNIEEITAMNALYRPGPMKYIPDFIDRKFGRKKIDYLHPVMEKTLKNTNGIIVYQEQVMQIARDIGGFTLGQADILRRAMGKKKIELMEEQKSIFVEGALKNGFDKTIAVKTFELIKQFASYGFNKSHSLAYSLLAYQTAWLKAYYPAEYIAANMTAKILEQAKIVEFMNEAKSLGIEVVPPDVNKSTNKFNAKDNIIYFSLAAIKNIGVPAAKGIMNARAEKGDFLSFFDFIKKVDTKYSNRKILEALIYAGAFDSLNSGNRATLYANIDMALDFAKAYHSTDDSMDSLFLGGDDDALSEPKLTIINDWQDSEKLLKEKEFLGFYVSGHPMNKYSTIIKQLSTLKLNELDSGLLMTQEDKMLRYSKDRSKRPVINQVRVCGIVTEIRVKLTKKNDSIAFAKIEDFTGTGELIFWSKAWEKCKDKFKENDIIVCVGIAEKESKTIKIFVDEVYDLFQGVEIFSRGLDINLNDNDISEKSIIEFSKLCTSTNHKLEIIFRYSNIVTGDSRIYLADDVELEISEYSFDKIIDIFGEKNVKLINSL